MAEANKEGRQERYVAKDRKFFDAIAQLLTGNEVCAAVAISGTDILIATNVGKQDERAICWHSTVTIIEKSPVQEALRLGFTCHLRSSSGEEITKTSIPFEYQFHVGLNKALLIYPKDANKISFPFSRGEFSYLPDDEVELKLSIYRELDFSFFRLLMQEETGKSFPFHSPVVTCRGALSRRTAKLFDHLSFIARSILQKLPYLPEHSITERKQLNQFLELEYQGYKQSKQPDYGEEEFIQIIRSKCTLDQEREQAVSEYYKAADLKDRALELLEKHQNWPDILNDTLTYELSKSLFNKEVSVDSKPPKGTNELDDLYRKLVQNYRKYKSLHKVQSSIPSILSWLDSLKENQSSLTLPLFVAARFSDFWAIARRYFIQLTVVEEYIKENAESNGALARRLAQETIFKKPKNVKIIQGKKGVHAEMRLFDYHLLESRPLAKYYGIAKLCCSLCHYTFKQFGTSGFHPPETRGTHAGLFTWPLPEAFYQERYMEVFLGKTLFEEYDKLPKSHRLESPKKGNFYNAQEVFQAIISSLDGINSEKNLKALNVCPNFKIQGSRDHYADNQIPPRLPPSHPSAGKEEQLEKLVQSNPKIGNPDIFDALETLGRAWREQKNNPCSYYYLTRAVQIFDQFLSSIDPLRAAEVFNTLGNVCKGLKLYDKSYEYLSRALKIKQEVQAAPYQIAVTLNSLGSLHTDRNDLFKASEFFTDALKQAGNGEKGKALAALIQRNLERLDEAWKAQ